MQKLALVGLCTLALCAYGCEDDGPGDDDAGPGTGMDAGPGGGGDAGPGGGTDAGPGGGTDGSTGTDAGPGGGTDGSTGTDGGNVMRDGGGVRGIPCGDGMMCDPSTEQCCAAGGIGGARQMCIPATDMCDGVSRACDGPEDCGSGEVCCARRSGGTRVETACVATAMCEGGFTSFELCHTMADCSTATDMCCPATFLPGFDGTCREMCGFTP